VYLRAPSRSTTCITPAQIALLKRALGLRPDNQVHHVQTWVTQRETWLRRDDRWLLWRVDRLRNQRRLVEGRPG
jgi:hypothetical protein